MLLPPCSNDVDDVVVAVPRKLNGSGRVFEPEIQSTDPRPVLGDAGQRRNRDAFFRNREDATRAQTLHPAPELARIIPPQELSLLVWRREVGNYRVGSGGGARAGDVGTAEAMTAVTASYSPASGRLPQG